MEVSHGRPSASVSTTTSRARAPIVLAIALALFVGLLVFLVASSLSARTAPEFDPTPPGRIRPLATGDWEDTLTLDARDERAWRFVTLADGAVLDAQRPSAWDLAARRHHIIARGDVADLGNTPFDSVTYAPSHGFEPTIAATDTTNAATWHWYRYGMLSHLLEPNGHVFAVRTADARYYKFEILSYYCRGLEAGCVTLRVAPLAGPLAGPRAGPRAAPIP